MYKLILVFYLPGITKHLRNGGIVTSDGQDVKDLWWALRGGGPGLGIVTAYKFAIHDPPAQFFQVVMVCPLEYVPICLGLI